MLRQVPFEFRTRVCFRLLICFIIFFPLFHRARLLICCCLELTFSLFHRAFGILWHSRMFWKALWRSWNATEPGLNPTINWKIINQVIPYKPGQKCCNLCLTEKLEILQTNQPTILNKRSELTGKCRHKNKFKFK